MPALKRLVPAHLLASADGAVQSVSARWKLTPSVFVRSTVPGKRPASASKQNSFSARSAQARWRKARLARLHRMQPPLAPRDQIYDFKEPLAAA